MSIPSIARASTIALSFSFPESFHVPHSRTIDRVSVFPLYRRAVSRYPRFRRPFLFSSRKKPARNVPSVSTIRPRETLQLSCQRVHVTRDSIGHGVDQSGVEFHLCRPIRRRFGRARMKRIRQWRGEISNAYGLLPNGAPSRHIWQDPSLSKGGSP